MENKEMEDMPIWQNHENRITTLETTFTGFSHEMKEVKDTVNKTSEEQKKLLNTLIEHHLSTNKMKLSKMWQLILNIFSASGIIGVIIYAVIQFI